MDVELMRGSPIGRVVPVRVYDARDGETYDHFAYIPDPLPATVDLTPPSWKVIADAQTAIGRLDGAVSELPNPMLLVRPLIRREAVSTSALEGTYSEIDELLGAEVSREELQGDVREVMNYVSAAEAGIAMLSERPVSTNMIHRLHGILLRGVRGDSGETGRIRSGQNWIGPRECRITESTFVPPPAEELVEGLSEWEKWIHNDDDLPLLLRAALGHYQFETLHPYTDGNGRLGRLIIVLQLIGEAMMSHHMMTISPYFERRRDEYMRHLRAVTATGDYEPWIQFFCEGLRESAVHGLTRIRRFQDMRATAVQRLRDDNLRGLAIQIAEDLIGYPVLTVPQVEERYGVSYQAANKAVKKLVQRGILSETTGKTYGRLFAAEEFLKMLR